jgi:hypothetical protein
VTPDPTPPAADLLTAEDALVRITVLEQDLRDARAALAARGDEPPNCKTCGDRGAVYKRRGDDEWEPFDCPDCPAPSAAEALLDRARAILRDIALLALEANEEYESSCRLKVNKIRSLAEDFLDDGDE